MMSAFPHAMPLEGLLGGLMIGAAGALMLLGLGRIAGVSGLAARAAGLAETGAPRLLAALFVAGLPLGAMVVAAVRPVPVALPTALLPLVAGGALVGFGTRLGSGCTSGHGVCGLARLSPRSVAATAVFMLAGFATVALMRLAGAP